MTRRILGARTALLARVAALALALSAWADATWACTVCYGDSEAAIIQGAQQATVLMVALTYVLLGGGVATFVILRRRSRLGERAEMQEGASR